MPKQTLAYGTWPSPIGASLVAEAGAVPGWLQTDGEDLYWVELRPAEGGRYGLVRRTPDGRVDDVLPPGWNCRTLVHEYGGGAYLVRNGAVFFSSFDDQRVYRQDGGGEKPRPLTEAPDRPRADRYADFSLTPDGRFLICVRERHLPSGDVVNDLVALPADGGAAVPLTGGRDFYSSPRVSPDGHHVAWLEWDHPQMPWDGTELLTATLTSPVEPGCDEGTLSADADRAGAESAVANTAGADIAGSEPVGLADVVRVAGGPEESVLQPDWDAQGRLHFVSDRSGWWNVYRLEDQRPRAADHTAARSTDAASARPLDPRPVEQAKAPWVFGLRSYGFLNDGRVAIAFTDEGLDHVDVIDPATGERQSVDCGLSSIAFLATQGMKVWVSGSGPETPPVVVAADLGSADSCNSRPKGTVAFSTARRRTDPSFIVLPEAIVAPASSGDVVHALYYPPHNPDVEGPPDERPPLIVCVHGGPTSAAEAQYSPEVQFWTTRGFAYTFVNYGGSTGYGRRYRDRLKGTWGIVDVLDSIAVARYLAARGNVDGRRCVIRGGSAGGYTTLCALIFHDVFAAGASYFGVAALEEFVQQTHKFESRYGDGLLGPWPEAADVYRERSPVAHADGISAPVLLLQGLEDAIVPPAQAEIFVAALERKRLPYAYLAFAGEQHGFRQAATVQAALEAELSFYGAVLGFSPADDLPPLEIHNAESLER